jgi:hypothetical protein
VLVAISIIAPQSRSALEKEATKTQASSGVNKHCVFMVEIICVLDNLVNQPDIVTMDAV